MNKKKFNKEQLNNVVGGNIIEPDEQDEDYKNLIINIQIAARAVKCAEIWGWEDEAMFNNFKNIIKSQKGTEIKDFIEKGKIKNEDEWIRYIWDNAFIEIVDD